MKNMGRNIEKDMEKKSTEDLENTLKSTHIRDFDRFRETNRESLAEGEELFSGYIKEKIRKKGLTQQMVFLMADIPERYGYKLLSGEKKTRQRDIILRICYAAELSLEETQEALRKYPMPELYARIPRDALLMIAFNERSGSVLDVNTLLKKHGMDSPSAAADLLAVTVPLSESETVML